MHMRCIDCTEPATHPGRCTTHHGAYSHVQVLCQGCHGLKTATDFGAARTA